MSVYKEDAMMLYDLMNGQRQIYSDAADCGYVVKGREDFMAADAKVIKTLHNFVVENREFGDVVARGNTWSFRYLMQEGDDDGRAYGWETVIAFHKDPNRKIEFVSVFIRNL